jgi:anti-anti-sigma factor
VAVTGPGRDAAADPPPLEVVTLRDDGALVVRARGDVDMSSVPLLADALEAAPAGLRLVLDLSEVGYLDSSGLRCLVAARAVHDELTLLAPSQPVRRVLEVTGLLGEFRITDGDGTG